MVIVHALLITMMVSGATVFGMENNESLINKPFNEWAKSYESKGRTIEEAMRDYEREHPSFHELYAPRYEELERIIKEEQSMFEGIAPKIRALAQKDRGWKKIVDRACYTEPLLYMVNRHLDNYACFKNGFDLSVRYEGKYIYLELAAVLLGTPGAIAFGREFIKQDSAKKRLKDFLFTVVQYGHQGNSCTNHLAWPDEDVDVVRAGLEMGLDPCMLSGDDDPFGCSEGTPLVIAAVGANKVKVVELLLDRGVDKDIKFTYTTEYNDSYKKVPSYTQSYTALYAAAEHGSQNTVDLLIKRGAQINAADAFGRTPLMRAVMSGYTEIVRKLLAAKADVSLTDTDGKAVLNHAMDKLWNCKKEEDKQKYNAIVKLLVDAGAIESDK